MQLNKSSKQISAICSASWDVRQMIKDAGSLLGSLEFYGNNEITTQWERMFAELDELDTMVLTAVNLHDEEPIA